MKKLPNGYRNLSRNAVRLARQFRRVAGVSEKVFWDPIEDRKTGFRFRRQVAVGKYFLDFCYAEAKVCVETDGECYPLRIGKDRKRDADLAELGVFTVRIPSLDLLENTCTKAQRWLKKIVAVCEERSGRKAF